MTNPRCLLPLILSIVFLHGHGKPISIELRGNYFFSDSYIGEILEKGHDRDVEHIIHRIINLYNNAGYPFCRIIPEIVRQDSTTARIILNIDEGENVIISDYFYTTTGRTSTAVLKRIAGGKPDTPFTLRNVNIIKHKLLITGIFDNIIDNIVRKDDQYYLHFDMHEKKSDFISLLGSYGENRLNLLASVFTRNLLGTLRGIQFDYEHERTFSLLYHDPVTVIPITIDGKFLLITEDSVRLTDINGKVLVPVNRTVRLGISSGYEAASCENDTNANYQSNSAGLMAVLQHGDGLLTLESSASLDYLFRTLDRLRLMYDGSLDIMRMKIAFHYRYAWADSFNYFDYFRIGGAEDLRGYREDEFFARKARWFTIEYHRLPVFPLVDIGYINNDFVSSFGFGINARSRIGTATLIIAWPGSMDWRWQDGILHLRLITGL